MDENTKNAKSKPGTQEPDNAQSTVQANDPNPNAGENAEEKMMTFDQSTLNAFLAKEKQRGKTAVLKALGLKDEKELADYTAKVNALLEAEKSKATDGDRLKELSEQFEQLKNDHTANLAELSVLKQKEVVRSYGESDPERIEFIAFKLSKQVTDDKDFAEVAADYFKANPVKKETDKEKPPPFYAGSKAPDNAKPPSTLEIMTAAARKGAGLIKNKKE